MFNGLIVALVIAMIANIITGLFSPKAGLRVLPWLIYYCVILVMYKLLTTDLVWGQAMLIAKKHPSSISYIIVILISALLGFICWKAVNIAVNRIDQRLAPPSTEIVKETPIELPKGLTKEDMEKVVTEALNKRFPKDASPGQFTNKQLSVAAISLAKRMRNFESKYKQDYSIAFDKWRMSNTLTEEQKNVRWSEQNRELDKLREVFEIEFKNSMLGEAVYLRDELQKRLSKKAQEEAKSSEYMPLQLLAFDGILAGPSPVADAANYLERLSRKLSPQIAKRD
jgi:hypothetical protein